MPRPFSPKAVLALLLAGALSISACDLFEQDDYSFQDDPQLEFFPLTATVDEGAGTVTAAIQLIGPQRDADLAVSFAVDDSSSAVEGEQYTLGSTSATISSGESSTEITIDVLDNGLDDGDTNYLLYLTLDDSEGVEAAVNLRTHVLTIRGTDEDDEG